MRIEYENSFLDLVLFNSVHQFLSIPMQLVSLMVAALAVLEFSEHGLLAASICSALIYISVWLLQILFNVAFLYSKNNHSVLTKHILEIRDEGLFEETRYNQSLFYWHGLVRVASRPGFIAIYVTAQIAHIIPNRAFATLAQRQAFLAGVSERVRSSATRDRPADVNLGE